MKCAWHSYLSLLPPNIRRYAENYADSLLECRMRLQQSVEFITLSGPVSANDVITARDISYVLNIASKYSPWASSTVKNGFLTAEGGHRIGICGETVIRDGAISGIHTVTSICIRVARDFPGIGKALDQHTDNLLIIGCPGCGKTTLLRDLIRRKTLTGRGAVAVVDERRELFPVAAGMFTFDRGTSSDILSGCSKEEGIEILLRCMTPHWIAVDEITSQKDCNALLHACWCGVKLICTAHADNLADLLARPVYKPLVDSRLFHDVVVMQSNKSWKLERMKLCT